MVTPLPAAAPALGSGLPGPDPVVAAAGDVSCPQGPDGSTSCRDEATSDLLVNQGLARVLGLGDQQYNSGELTGFNSYYDLTWGRVKEITSPSPGNHDPFSSGYSAYFGSRAPAPYYSYDIGQWHLISLDSNNVDSAQVSWLHSDLAANAGGKCVLAYWHHSRFSSGTTHGNSTKVIPFWTELYNANADLVLSAHEHNYERFAPQDPNGTADMARGVREFVVGTGGKSHYVFGSPQPNSEVRSTGTFGVLELALRPGAYEWQFVPEAGQTFSDSGTGVCHSAADVSLTKSDSPDPVLAGQNVTYTLTARNDGPSVASGVTVTDNLPAQVSYESAAGSQGSCSEASGTVTCSLGTLTSGATATATIAVRTSGGGTITNSAAVQATQADPAVANNSAIESTTVDTVADLSLTKADSPDPVLSDETLTYDLTVRNNGPSGATGIAVTDNLPAGVTYQSGMPSQGTCSEASGTVACDLGAIANGGSATVQIVVTPQGEGTISNSAGVHANESDPSASNDTASADTAVLGTGYAHPKGATPVMLRLVPAFEQCQSANSTHGLPLLAPSCSPPVQSSGFLTFGTPERNGKGARSAGFAIFQVVGESPIDPTNGDQGDVRITAQLTDVRDKSDLSDYTGELEGVLGLRITDRLNGPGQTTPATVTDTPLRFTIGCASTTGTPDIGADCNVLTTADAVAPGMVVEGKRSIWALSQLQIYDGGADGVASTADNTLFAIQGVFVP